MVTFPRARPAIANAPLKAAAGGGWLPPVPVLSALTHFPEDFDRAPRVPAAAE